MTLLTVVTQTVVESQLVEIITETVLTDNVVQSELTEIQLITKLEALPSVVSLINTGLIGPKGDRGIPGPAGNAVQAFQFSYGDATPAILVTAVSGQRILGVRLDILTAFNGVGAQLSIGTMADPQSVFPTTDNSALIVSSFDLKLNTLYSQDTDIFLWITAGQNASAGSGQVLIFIQ